MRRELGRMPVRGRVVIGEGERDRAPMLWTGEAFGSGDQASFELDIAVDPLEGTNLCATGGPGAIAVLAAAPRGGLLTAPDVYMDKIAVGPRSRPLLGGAVGLERDPAENLRAIAAAEGVRVAELTVVVLDRSRHADLIAALRRAGARVRLIGDGDLSAAILAATPGSGVHAAIGSGGAPEGVIAAAALRCLGGGMLGRLVVRDEADRRRIEEVAEAARNPRNPFSTMTAEELAPGAPLRFCAAGVTDGPLVGGVRFAAGGLETQTLTLESDPPEMSRTVRRRMS